MTADRCFVQNGVEKPIFDGPLLKMSSSRFQLNAPFSQNTGLYTRIFENAAIFIRVVVVLRPRAIALALTACTCADVIQPCSFALGSRPTDQIVFVTSQISTRLRRSRQQVSNPVSLLSMLIQTHRRNFPLAPNLSPLPFGITESPLQRLGSSVNLWRLSIASPIHTLIYKGKRFYKSSKFK